MYCAVGGFPTSLVVHTYDSPEINHCVLQVYHRMYR